MLHVSSYLSPPLCFTERDKNRATHIICERVDKRLPAAASLNSDWERPTRFVVAASDVRRVKACKCVKSLHYSCAAFRKDKVHFHIPARWRAGWEILYQWMIKWEQIALPFPNFSQDFYPSPASLVSARALRPTGTRSVQVTNDTPSQKRDAVSISLGFFFFFFL